MIRCPRNLEGLASHILAFQEDASDAGKNQYHCAKEYPGQQDALGSVVVNTR